MNVRNFTVSFSFDKCKASQRVLVRVKMLTRLAIVAVIAASTLNPVALQANPSDSQAKKALQFTEQGFRNNLYVSDTPGDPTVLISTEYGPHSKLKSNGGEATVSLNAGITRSTGSVIYALMFKVDYFGSRWAFIDAVTHDAYGYPKRAPARTIDRHVITCFSSCKYAESFVVPVASEDIEQLFQRKAGMTLSFAGGGQSWSLTVPGAEVRVLKEAVDAFKSKQALSTTTINPTPKPELSSRTPVPAGDFWHGAFAMSFEDAKRNFPNHRLVTHEQGTSVVTGLIDSQFGIPLELALVFNNGKLNAVFWTIPPNSRLDANLVESAYLRAVTKLGTIYTKEGAEKVQLIGNLRNRITKLSGEQAKVDVTYLDIVGTRTSLHIRADLVP